MKCRDDLSSGEGSRWRSTTNSSIRIAQRSVARTGTMSRKSTPKHVAPLELVLERLLDITAICVLHAENMEKSGPKPSTLNPKP